MPKPQPLELSSPSVAEFIHKAPAPAASSRPAPSSPPVDTAPKRGHVMQASGRVVRRLVVNVDPDIGKELERRHLDSGASLSRIAGDLLREALGL